MNQSPHFVRLHLDLLSLCGGDLAAGVTLRGPKHRCPKCGNREWSNALLYHGLIFHDLRRSAVRNLRKWGIDETEIMAVTGQKNRSMFARYSIVSERDMAEMFERAERARAAEQELLRLEADKAMREEVSGADSVQVRAKVGTEPLPN